MNDTLNFVASGETDIGLMKNTNQDSYGLKIIQTPLGKVAFAVLCDGMGGYSKGEVASATLVKAFLNWINTRFPFIYHDINQAVIRQEWENLALEYNKKIGTYGKRLGITLGTTLTAILLTETQYFAIHVGDSRIYEITNQITILTKDQTLVAKEVEQKLISEAAAECDPRRSILLQCIGASNKVIPDFLTGKVKKNATYMLCSDGFYHKITLQEIYHYLNPDSMCQTKQMSQNMRLLIETNKQRMEHDNISVVSIKTY